MTAATSDYVYIQDIQSLIDTIQAKGIVSRTVYKDDQINLVLFAFDTGETLSEHTASQPATIQILQGEATITLAGDTKEVAVGTWLHMPPNMPHSVVAKTPLIMLLTLFKTKAS
jgi:quercetin dioxygenase-like cupin family protein